MSGRAERARRSILGVALVLSGWAAAIWLTGGVHLSPFGIRLSSADPRRPLAVAIVLSAVYVCLWPRSFRAHVAAIGDAAVRRAALVTCAMAFAVFAVAIARGSTVASAADPYGYVSQAALWRHGRLTVPIAAIARVPWRDAQWTFSPLGYRPSVREPDAIVPTYAPGFPLLMAALQLPFGYPAAFVVVPVAGAALVWLTFVLGRRMFESDAIGLWAAALVAASPAFLFQLMWPMSDVPVAAAWTAALVCAVFDWPVAAGLMSSATIVIRPNLILLPAALIGWSLARGVPAFRVSRLWSDLLRRSVWIVAGLVPGVLFVAAVNARLYGSPFQSGYGSTGGMFAADRGWTNAVHYGTWLIETQTPLVACAAIYLVAPRWCARSRIQSPRLLVIGTIVAAVVSYLFYEVFNDWWYLRFLLPMWPVLMITVAAGIDGALRRWTPVLRPIALAAAVVFLGVSGLRLSDQRGVFSLGRGERRYVDVARYVDDHTEPDAVILAMQHSGSIRHYAGRLTLRYDQIAEGELDRTIAYLASSGRHPYIVLENWEAAGFIRRHAASSRVGRLDWPPIARLSGWNDVALYDPLTLGEAIRTASIPPVLLQSAFGWPVPAPGRRANGSQASVRRRPGLTDRLFE